MVSDRTFQHDVVDVSNEDEYVNCVFQSCRIYGERFYARNCNFNNCSILCNQHVSLDASTFVGGYATVSNGDISVFGSSLETTTFQCHDVVIRHTRCRDVVELRVGNMADFYATSCESLYVYGSALSLHYGDVQVLHGAVQSFTARHTNVTRSFELDSRTISVVDCGSLLSDGENMRECVLCGEKARRLNYDQCCDQCCMKNYSHEMDFHNRAQSDNLPSFGVELELSYNGHLSDSAKKLSVALIRAGWARCSDGSVDVEFKSPIFTSLDQLKPSYELMQRAADLDYINEDCGTHFHVGCSGDLIERFKYNSRYGVLVFSSLTEFMRESREETEKIYGRGFCGFAEDMVHPDNRYSWLNVGDEHGHHTIECRLPRLNSVPSYEKLLTFWREQINKLDDAHNSRTWRTSELSAGLLHNYQENFL